MNGDLKGRLTQSIGKREELKSKGVENKIFRKAKFLIRATQTRYSFSEKRAMSKLCPNQKKREWSGWLFSWKNY